jgi:hypothetical protein
MILAAANVLGVVLLVVGWWGASRELTVDDQVVWTNTAFAGVAIAAAGSVWWLVVGRRAVGRRVRLVRQAWGRAGQFTAFAPSADLVAAPGSTRYHRRNCALAAARDVRAAPRPVHERSGLRPCGVCRP